MIRKLKYHEVDFEKYTNCIENSVQRKYSATKEFLNVVCKKNWDVLVYGDYQALMPIPYVKKMGIKLVVNPKLCQQLGVFSAEDNSKINDEFLNFLRKHYKVVYYAFNDTNQFSKPLLTRKNFILVPDIFENVYKKYSPKRKRKLRLDEDVLLNSKIKEVSFKDILSFVEQNIIGVDKPKNKKDYLRIFNDFDGVGKLKIYTFTLNERIINAIIVYSDRETMALLGTFNEREFVKIAGASVLINHAISLSIHEKEFDFEGGDLPNIEEFFRGFRPEMKPYPYINNTPKDILLSLLSFNFRGIY